MKSPKPRYNDKLEVAVALEYGQAHRAPVVSSKGSNKLVKEMKRVARRYGIPQVAAAGLAKQLSELEEQQEIPQELFKDVATAMAQKMSVKTRR